MTIERAVFLLAGSMVLLTSLLAIFHNPNWTWFTVFIGFNIIQSTFTGFCPPGMIMKKMGMKSAADQANS